MLKFAGISVRVGAALVAVILASSAYAAPPAGFEQRVEQLRKDFGTPGVTIAVVEDGKTTCPAAFLPQSVPQALALLPSASRNSSWATANQSGTSKPLVTA